MKSNSSKEIKTRFSQQTPKMTVFTVKGDRTPVNDAEYVATITNVEESTYKEKRKCLKLTFEIAEGPNVGRLLFGWINADPEVKMVSMNTKLARWYSAANGHTLGDEDVIDPMNFLNKVVRVRTKTNTTKWDNQFSNVEEILGHVADIDRENKMT